MKVVRDLLCKEKIMRRTQEQMQQVILQWQQSGQSKKAFCRDHNITSQTFHYWYKRIRSEPGSGFSEVHVEAMRSKGFEVIFPSGTRMVFFGEPSARWLRELVG
jgi:transposase-like protein